MSLRLREARREDAGALAELSGQLGYPAGEADLRDRLERLWGDSDHAVWVVLDEEDGVAGWAHVFVARRVESAPFAELGGLVVREDKRGMGAGRLLVDRAALWAAERGVSQLRVRTRQEREGAGAFYQRLGFKQAKVQRVFLKAVGPGRVPG